MRVQQRAAERRPRALLLSVACLLAATAAAQDPALSGLQVVDLYRLRTIGDVQLSPDGARVAYTVMNYERPGRPYSQIWIADVASGRSSRLSDEADSGSSPRWSPDGRRIAYFGRGRDGAGLLVRDLAARVTTFVGPVTGTNHPLPSMGERVAWSPDSRQLAFVSTTPGPEGDAAGDPVVVTRYLFKPAVVTPDARFNDNRRTHIFLADFASGDARQLTSGRFYEHSIDWSPAGGEIVFLSNRNDDPDRIFNYDIFAVAASGGAVRRITSTPGAEYYPKWSPDGRSIAFTATTRPLTSSETTMEDTHVWVMRADGTERREIGAAVDNRQGAPEWSADGRYVYFRVQEKGNVTLARLPVRGGPVEPVIAERGNVGGWSLARDAIAASLTTDTSPGELVVRSARGLRAITALNGELLARRTIAPVEAFTFKSFDGTDIEAFLTRPASHRARTTPDAAAPAAKAPLIVMIHGGPHAQQGAAFNAKAQIYAAEGSATLMVNYRGSTGYGQKLADAIFKDQNGGEARDVLAGVDAALRRYPWLDADRLGIEGISYGGQLTNWIVSQTPRFKAAIPLAGISNLVSFNYTAYYHDYLAVEFGGAPHEPGLIDLLWQRSPIRHVHKVRTPTLLLHGEDDTNVPIAEAEQLFVALMDAGVETQLVRYPREGHGLRETKHVADSIERSIAWYRKCFSRAAGVTRRSPAAPQSERGGGAR